MSGRDRLLLIGFLVWCGGCLYIPTSEHVIADTRDLIENDRLAFLDGKSVTKEEVLLTLGEPDWESKKGKVFVYTWKVVKGYWVLVGLYPILDELHGPFPEKRYALLIEFDDRNAVARHEVGESYWDSRVIEQVEKW